jgi:hypothetical protein
MEALVFHGSTVDILLIDVGDYAESLGQTKTDSEAVTQLVKKFPACFGPEGSLP